MNIKRTNILLTPDKSRVLLRPFNIPGDDRIKRIVDGASTLTDNEAARLLKNIIEEFGSRHKNIEELFIQRAGEFESFLSASVSDVHRKLIGAYFMMEYSVESAALFNPSAILAPHTGENISGSAEFILSLRSTGEGHISSLQFRSGNIDPSGTITFDAPTPYLISPEVESDEEGNYTLRFPRESTVSERIIFPFTPDESSGIEDVRFVQFTEDDGSRKYYATYTAYNGKVIKPKLLLTTDFVEFKMITPRGAGVSNKGMALFPEKINDQYVMISRQDNENIFIMYSNDINKWDSKELLMTPQYPWEMVQLGNCGSPIKTEKGWLLLTHGVGPLRKYVISAVLLDLANPSKITGRLREPLLAPDASERDGYVPNVVYSCGGFLHNDKLILPYAVSDYASSIATIGLNEILSNMI